MFLHSSWRIHAKSFTDHLIKVLHLEDDVIVQAVPRGGAVVNFCMEFFLDVWVCSHRVGNEDQKSAYGFVTSKEKYDALENKRRGKKQIIEPQYILTLFQKSKYILLCKIVFYSFTALPGIS